MAGLFGKITSFVSGYLEDPAKLEPIIAQCFGLFDKDKSGFVEGTEVKACAQMVCERLGMASLPVDKLDMVFARVAGPDQKVDKTEFSQLVHQLLKAVDKDAADAPAVAAPVAPAPAAPAE